MKMKIFVTFFIFSLFLSSCLSTRFSTESKMKLKIHMSSDEIIKMFGKPEDISVSICGAKTGNTWTCTSWKYGDYSSGKASFTFYERDGKLYLNNYDVDR
jgi:hypothetical protein